MVSMYHATQSMYNIINYTSNNATVKIILKVVLQTLGLSGQSITCSLIRLKSAKSPFKRGSITLPQDVISIVQGCIMKTLDPSVRERNSLKWSSTGATLCLHFLSTGTRIKPAAKRGNEERGAAGGVVKECVSFLDDEWKNNRMEGDKKRMLFFSRFSSLIAGLYNWTTGFRLHSSWGQTKQKDLANRNFSKIS